MWPDFVSYALVGLGGGLVYSMYKLRDDLCTGEQPPTRREAARAWMQFATFIIAAPLFAGTATGQLTLKLKGWASWPEIAVLTGMFTNVLWPIATKIAPALVNDEVARRLKGAWDAITGKAEK